MPRGRPVAPVVLCEEEKSQLLSLANSRALPHSLVQRAQAILFCAESEPNSAIAKRMGLNNLRSVSGASAIAKTVSRDCTMNFVPGDPGPMPMSRSPKSSKPRCRLSLPSAPTGVCALWPKRLGCRKAPSSAGSTRSGSSPIASAISNSPTTPYFIENVRNIVGLYLNPPEHAVVLRADETNPGPSAEPQPAHAADGAGLRGRSHS